MDEKEENYELCDVMVGFCGGRMISLLSLFESRNMATGTSTFFRLFNEILACRPTSSPAMQNPRVGS